MKFVFILLTIFCICLPAAQAKYRSPRTTCHHGHNINTPAHGMLQSLSEMSSLLNSVHSRHAADTAAPRLLSLYHQYLAQRNAAENMTGMSSQAMDRHLALMDSGMNDFRLACARLIQKNFYNSPDLKSCIRTIAENF